MISAVSRSAACGELRRFALFGVFAGSPNLSQPIFCLNQQHFNPLIQSMMTAAPHRNLKSQVMDAAAAHLD
jgi:hypothetical protein